MKKEGRPGNSWQIEYDWGGSNEKAGITEYQYTMYATLIEVPPQSGRWYVAKSSHHK